MILPGSSGCDGARTSSRDYRQLFIFSIRLCFGTGANVNRILAIATLIIALIPAALVAQSTSDKTQSGTGAIATTPEPKQETKKPAKKSEAKNFHVEVGGFWSPTVPGPGRDNWRGWDTRLLYSGFKRFTPFGGVSRINTAEGGQIAYGFGSYVSFTKWFYAIGGASFSRTAPLEFSPHRRYDIAGLFAVPGVKGMVFSTGLTVLPAYKNSGGGRILGLGDIYYWRKFIFGNNLNINFAEPGNRRTLSGQTSVTYGSVGKYTLAAGMSGGGAAYMIITGSPFEVRYQAIGGFGSFTKWFTWHSGITTRYGYNSIIGSTYQRHSIRTALFFDF
jgi:YaiO family outer membrane protein